MNEEKVFSYKYSAEDNKKLQEIRNKYLPYEESKLDEVKRLDRKVQKSGTAESLIVGIISSLIFGAGMCLAMQVIGSGTLMIVLGVVIGIVGMVGMYLAYPVYKHFHKKAKSKYSTRILELTEELANEM